jgi:hypothetical protein
VAHRAPPRRQLPRDGLWIFGAWLLGALVFFREQWDSSFKWLMGNDGDTRLAAYLSEHWFQVLHGQASWLNPSFFYPVKGVLGWSDTFFIYQVFYAPLRLLGADPFLALQLTIVIFSLVGFVTFVYLVRLGFGTGLPAAVACGLIFTFSNALWIHAGSPQLGGIYLVPAVLLIALLSWRAVAAGRRLRAGVLAALAGLLWGLILYSTYYIGWFSTLALVLVFVLLLLIGGRSFIRQVFSAVSLAAPIMAYAGVGLIVGLIPFARTYLPVQHANNYAYVVSTEGNLRDVFNVGNGNVLWSHVLTRTFKGHVSNYELSYAVTPTVMLLALAGAALALWLLLSRRCYRQGVARLTVALTLSAIAFTVLPLRTRFGTAWALIWHLPGASAMRAIDRIQVVTSMLAILAIAAAASELSRLTSTWNRWRIWQVAGLILLAVAIGEQVNTSRTSYVNRVTQVAFLSSLSQPPAGCRRFFVVDSARRLTYYEYQVDAMLVSQHLSVPTINGYSGHFPSGWGLLNPSQPTYPAAVSEWASANQLDPGLCRLDLGSMRWSMLPTQP